VQNLQQHGMGQHIERSCYQDLEMKQISGYKMMDLQFFCIHGTACKTDSSAINNE
jgi:hypothetical protein